jgi:TonB family protein
MSLFSRMFRVVISTWWYALCLSISATHGAAAVLIQNEKQPAEQHIQNAREALQNKKYGRAKDEAKRALSLNRMAPEPYLVLAIASRQQGELTDAMKYVKQALDRKTDYADAHYVLGLLQFQKRDFIAAQAEASMAIAQGLSFPNVYELLAQADLAINKTKEAVDALENALRFSSTDRDEAARIKEQIEALNGWIGSEASRHDPSYAKPQPLNSPRPTYTDEAREAKIQGRVRLAVLLDERGNVTSTLVFVGIGFGLDREAINAAQKLRFKPAMKDGKPVPFWQMVIVEFNLRSSFKVIQKTANLDSTTRGEKHVLPQVCDS